MNNTIPIKETSLRCYTPLVAQWALGVTLIICGIALATGNLFPGLPIWFRCLVWITCSATYIITPTDFRFFEQGIVIEKFGKRTQIPWENIVQVRRDPPNTSIFVDMQTLTRYEKLVVGRFSISPLMHLHYREADALIREKVGTRYKRLWG